MILFISTHTGNSWGGSEQLWTRTAALLARQGLAVSASVHGWHHLDPHVIDLLRAGVDVRSRPIKPSFIDKLRRHISARTQIVVDIERSFANVTPSLVVISNGADFPPIELAEWCVEKGWPFVTLANAISSDWWHTDEMAARWRAVLPLARRCLFVSKQNRALAERQLGFDFDNAEIVLNPVLVDTTLRIPWPAFENQLLRMACVSRLDIAQKGQDILLEAIAGPRWSKREWHVTFYGKGPNQDSIERLARRLKIRD